MGYYMSTIDIKIQNRCDHTVVGERMVLSADMLTLNPQFPITSYTGTNLLRFRIPVDKSQFSLKLTPNSTYEGYKYTSIQLARPDMYPDPFYEVSYPTLERFCPKCAGATFSDDISFQTNSAIYTTMGPYNLIQAVEKFIVTGIGSSRYSQWMGSGLDSLIGTKIRDVDALKAEMQAQVRASLNNLSSVQTQHQTVNSAVTSDEVINNIEAIEVTQDTVDPSVFRIYVQYTSQSGAKYDYTQILDLATLRAR
jgi:hypothetical protein